MTLRHLKIFIAVCEYGSTTKAAEALYIVQPTISHTITELEKYYKVSLFDRVNQRLVLTEVGKELLVKAKEIVSGFDDFESLATFRGQSPKVKIGSSLTLGQTLIPRYLQKVEESGIEIQPEIIIRQALNVESELEQGNLDFAIIGGNVMSPYLKATPIAYDRFLCVAHADYDVPNELKIEELFNYPLLLREKGSSSRDFLEEKAENLGVKIIPKIDSANNQALIAALYASLGVAFLPESYVAGHIERKKIKEIKIKDLKTDRTNYLVIHKNKKLNELQLQAYELLKSL